MSWFGPNNERGRYEPSEDHFVQRRLLGNAYRFTKTGARSKLPIESSAAGRTVPTRRYQRLDWPAFGAKIVG